jgi:hypothetical protein
MNISLLFVIIFLVGMIIKSICSDKSKRIVENFFVVTISILFILSAAFRSWMVGSDTPDYVNDYNNICYLSVSSLFDEFSNSVGYYFLSWVAYKLGFPLIMWFGTVELLYLLGILMFIYRFSEDRLFSFFCFFTIGLFFPSFNILKQILAISIVLLAYSSFEERKFTRTIILTIIAILFHQSAIVFCMAFLIKYYSNNKNISNVIMMLCVISAVFGGTVFPFLMGSYANEHYADYIEADNELTNTMLYYIAIILAIMYANAKGYKKKDNINYETFFRLSIVGCMFQSLSSSFSIAHRFAYYFFPFIIVLLPNIIINAKNRSTIKLIKICVVCFMSFFTIYTQRLTPYSLLINI